MAMDPFDAHRKAGKIAAAIRDKTIKEIQPGDKAVDICDRVVKRVKELGGLMAFPVNVDIDHVAAHYCSPINDQTVIPENSLVKLDIGVHVDGYIADTAVTKCFDSSNQYLVDAAEAGLEAAINTIRPGIRANEVGAAIEEAIKGKGARPISNLTGHKLSRYIVHAGASIPNVNKYDSHMIQEGDVYAMEPFAVPMSADGLVTDGPPSNIYRLVKKRNVKGKTKTLMKYIQSEYKSLPFASRWIFQKYKGQDARDAFKELLKTKTIMSYPQLIERTRAKVAQAEHSVIVTKDGCEVFTA